MSATLDEVAAALKALDVRADVVDVKTDDGPPVLGLNVWVGDPTNRYADDTVWPPVGNDGWVWGDRFQWGIQADADADAVAQRVLETARARA